MMLVVSSIGGKINLCSFSSGVIGLTFRFRLKLDRFIVGSTRELDDSALSSDLQKKRSLHFLHSVIGPTPSA